MRRAVVLMLITLLAGTAQAAEPKVYKWTDASGTVHYSPTPPADDAVEVKLQKGPKLPPAEPAKVAPEETDADRCAQHRANLKLLEGNKPLTIEVNGKLQPLSAEQRAAQVRDARAALAQCEETAAPES